MRGCIYVSHRSARGSTMIGVAVKVVASIAAIGVIGVFLYALWIREVDVRQYATTKYWMGKWFETWFPEIPNLVKNGNFDQGAYGWGTRVQATSSIRSRSLAF